jgi:secondary thiamine-phosphate synthase enzyme
LRLINWDEMSKASKVTTRLAPVHDAAVSGAMVVRAETITVETETRLELVDISDRLSAFIGTTGLREGILSVWSLHTTCAVFINEAQLALHADIKTALENMIAREAEWMHNDPDHSDCDRFNADAHLRAMLLGHSLTLQVAGGEIVLGQWQRVLAAELDGPRTRTFRLQVMGVA